VAEAAFWTEPVWESDPTSLIEAIRFGRADCPMALEHQQHDNSEEHPQIVEAKPAEHFR
jgi:hypothetical protein